MNLIKRTDPRNLNPEDCCFIFPVRGKPFFRVYHRESVSGQRISVAGSFTDYDISAEVTPFVKLISDDVELKEYRQDNGEIHYLMDFPECALSDEVEPLGPGEVWNADH